MWPMGHYTPTQCSLCSGETEQLKPRHIRPSFKAGVKYHQSTGQRTATYSSYVSNVDLGPLYSPPPPTHTHIHCSL